MAKSETWVRGRYEILGLLGSGSQGAAIDVFDRVSNTQCVLKVFEPNMAEQAMGAFELLTQLASPFLPVAHGFFVINEADLSVFGRALERLSGPPSYRVGQACLVRSRVDGTPADEWGADRPWSARARLLWRVCELLNELHRSGFLHGDLKPEHVLIGEGDLPVLIDFGLSQNLRGTGVVGGTPLYMAPELFSGSRPSSATERYAFGVLAFVLAAGRTPFDAESIVEVARLHQSAPVPALPAGIPSRSASMIRHLMAKDAADRPVLEEVAAVLRPSGARALPRVVLPFMGRDQEVQTALARLDRGWSTWVVGPTGIGKTRFLQHVRWHAEAKGWVTLQAPPGRLGLEAKIEGLGQQLAGISGRTIEPLPRVGGDRLHQIRAYRDWLDALVPSSPPLLFWDDGDLLPDHLEFLEEYRRQGEMPYLASGKAGSGEQRGLLNLVPLGSETAREAAEVAGGRLNLTQASVSRAVRSARGNPRALQLALTVAADSAADAEVTQDSPLLTLLGSVPEPVSLAGLAHAFAVNPDDLVTRLEPHLAAGSVTRMGPGYALLRPLHRLVVLTDGVGTALRRLVDFLGEGTENELRAVVSLLAGGRGDANAAIDWLQRRDRRHFAFHFVGALVNAGMSAYGERLVELALALGEADSALEYLPTSDDAALQVARARLHYTLGQLDDALGAITRATSTTEAHPNDDQRTELCAIEAWVALRQGRHEDAARLTEVDPAEDVRGGTAAELLTARAAALMLTGDPAAQEAFRRARAALQRAGGMPRLQARLLSFQAMDASRRGDLEAARTSYMEALAVIETAELDADLPTFLLNAGTSHDHLGALAKARDLYRRGIRLAGEPASLSTRVLLLANQANIGLRLHRLDEAHELLDEIASLVQGRSAGRADAFVKQLRAELALRTGVYAEAEALTQELRRHFEEVGDRFGLAEVCCLAARAALRSTSDAAPAHLQHALELIEEHTLGDLRPLASVVQGELAEADSDSDAAIDCYATAIRVADDHGDAFRVVEAAEHLVGLQTLPSELGAVVDRALRRVIAGLGPVLRRDYLDALPPILARRVGRASETLRAVPSELARTVAHIPLGGGGFAPPGTDPAQQIAEAAEPALNEPGPSEEQLYRVLAITARLAREDTYERFLESALDTAIDLASAERGFLLLRRGESFRVAVSRDVDGDPIRRAILKVSTTIAERVAETGEPMISLDAQHDSRLASAQSVHQLSLTSVICLPLRRFGETVGVLYLDHRFREAAFTPNRLRLMMAFADQVAVAMLYLDRVSALERQNRELATAQRQVEELLAEKEQLAQSLEVRCADLETEFAQHKRQVALRFRYDEIVASAPVMRRLIERIDRVVDSAIPVLISGESGTGKELIARALHFNGPRQHTPFVPINCGAIPENLLESELFGHKKGAFTGADRDKDGLFVAAHGGTVFLDEIGELPVQAQVKLLRAIQEKQVRPVGGLSDLAIDVRLVAATNRNLLEMVEQGTFRADLYYRLAGLEVTLPPLRQRFEDIPLLVQHFTQRIADEEGTTQPQVQPDAMQLLYDYDWPGNVRQLQNVLHAAYAISDRQQISAPDVAPLLKRSARATAAETKKKPSRGRRGPRPKFRQDEVVSALREHHGDIDATAAALGVTPRSIYRYIKKWELEV